jgi:uncharacterized flavoprotein (TIGR03862 family)
MKKKETSNNIDQEKVSIIGAGASGYFLAYELLKSGKTVDLYDQTGGALKKFLIAGKGGLNLTHSDEIPVFTTKYGKDEQKFSKYLNFFSNIDLRNWFKELGIETYVGSSRRVFPKDKSAGDILKIWVEKCQSYSQFNFYPKHCFIDFKDGIVLKNENNNLLNLGKENIVLALGGASYKQTGSDASWVKIFKKMEIETKTFYPLNCGYEVDWTHDFTAKNDHRPLKNITLKCGDSLLRGEILITKYGVEGSGIYALSRRIDQIISKENKCRIEIDLKPDISVENMRERLLKPQNKNTFTNFLRKTLNLDPLSLELLKTVTTKDEFKNLEKLPDLIKACPLVLLRPRPIEEAISTGGGVSFDEVTEELSLKKYPGITVMGEMLDWDAQTGGYLFQGCFSMASWIAANIKIR